MKKVFLTSAALICFALNSIFARYALGLEGIDAISYTMLRLLAGAFALSLIFFIAKRPEGVFAKRRIAEGFFLFLYASTFSIAYKSLTAGTGALLLFGFVQLTIIVYVGAFEKKTGIIQIFGAVIAFSGVVYLVTPTVSSPQIVSAFLMACSGVAWGIYTLLGRKSENPAADTTANFIQASIFALISLTVIITAGLGDINVTRNGAILAVISGALTSGIGYIIWYKVLPGLGDILPAVFQLTVPLLTVILGIIFLSESASMRILLAGLLIIGGVGLTIVARNYRRSERTFSAVEAATTNLDKE
ncbi:MAG TPA: DMT family transporter [Pyrinomonadaceae bacterium]|nr:DMT family transporter [Pyrinomonadaceae bacterium]